MVIVIPKLMAMMMRMMIVMMMMTMMMKMSDAGHGDNIMMLMTVLRR